MSQRILWLSHDPRSSTSFGRQTDLLCQELNKKHYDIKVLGAGKKDQPEIYNGYQLYPYPKELGRKKNIHFGCAEIFNEYLELLQPDILVTLDNLARYEYIPEVFRSRKNKPYWLHWGPSETNMIFSENIELEKSPDQFLVLTKENLLTKEKYLKNLVKIGHAIDPTFRNLKKVENDKTRKELGFKSTDFICGCLAANNLRKQLPSLLECFAVIGVKQKNIKLLLFTNSFDGNNPESTDLEYYLENILKTKNIKIVYTDKMSAPVTAEYLNKYFYNSIDLFVSTTTGEGFCLPVGEAMACGKPAIVTKCPNISELIINNQTGLLAAVAAEVYDLIPRSFTKWQIVDPADFIKKVIKLSSQRTLLKKLGVAAKAHIENNFTLDKVILRLEKLFKKVSAPERTELIPDLTNLNEWLGLEYFKHGWWSELINITAQLHNAPIYNLRGLAYRRLKNDTLAIAEFKKALELDPELAIAKLQLKELLK